MGGSLGWVGLVLALGAGVKPPPAQLWTNASQQKVGAEHSAISEIARRALPAVVSISTEAPPEGGEPQNGLGSGFFIHPDGYLLTAAHVIEGVTEIKVTFLTARGLPEELPAKVIGQDAQTDLALLKVEGTRPFPVLSLASEKDVDVADWVVVIGNPFGLSHSVTVGVVSYKGRNDVVPAGRTGYFDYLQTDASINPGNSGGPILDMRGEVVAIANAVNVAGQGIGFGTPIDIAKVVLPQLKEHGSVRRGWLGVVVQDLTPELAAERKVESYAGVLITDVRADSPAARAGLKEGDLIVSFDGEAVERAHALRWRVASVEVGRPVPLTLRRKTEEVQLTLRLGEMPSQAPLAKAADSSVNLGLGATAGGVDKEASARCGLSEPQGALIRSVAPGSPLHRAGLAEGDVVLKLNTQEISSAQQLADELSKLGPGSALQLFARRATATLTFSLRKP